METQKRQSKYITNKKELEANKGEKDYEFLNEQNRLQVQSDLLATRRDLSNAEKKLAKEYSKDTISSTAIIMAKQDVASYKEGIEELEALVDYFQ